MREGAAAVAVANRPHPLRARAALVVDHDVAPLVGADAGPVQPDGIGVRAPAHGQQHMAADDARLLIAAGRADRDLPALRRQRQALRPQLEAHALGFEDGADTVGHVPVLPRQQARRALDHRHFGAEAPHHLRELQADVAAPDDDKVLGHAVELHDRAVVQRGHAVDARQRRPQRAPAQVEDDAWRRQPPARHLERGRCHEARLADDHLRMVEPAHPGFDARARLLHDRVLAGLDAGHVDLQAPGGEAELLAAPRQVHGTRAGHQRLGGHAADIDAGAAEVPPFDDGRAQALLAATRCDRRPGLARADDDGVKGFSMHGSFSPPDTRHRNSTPLGASPPPAGHKA